MNIPIVILGLGMVLGRAKQSRTKVLLKGEMATGTMVNSLSSEDSTRRTYTACLPQMLFIPSFILPSTGNKHECNSKYKLLYCEGELSP